MPEIQCPHCGRDTAVPAPRGSNGSSLAERGGEILDCQHCARSFALPIAEPAKSELPVAEAPIDWVAAGVAEAQPRRSSSAAPTEIPVALSGGIGLVSTALFYWLVVGPLADSYFGQLFSARGWVPYGIALLSGWSLAMLGFKSWRVLQQQRCLEIDYLPTSIATHVNQDNAQVFASYLRHLSATSARSFLGERLQRAVELLADRGSPRTVREQLARYSEADANAVDSSYTTLRVFIWAIPILGFIGTVLGIGAAVGAFSDTVSGAASLDLMKESIGSVATGLGVAFDTTLLALVSSIVLMFPMSSLQKLEESLLARIDDECDAQLTHRLDERTDTSARAESSRGNGNADPAADLEALGSAAGRSLRQLDAELNQLSRTVSGLTRRLAETEREQ